MPNVITEATPLTWRIPNLCLQRATSMGGTAPCVRRRARAALARLATRCRPAMQDPSAANASSHRCAQGEVEGVRSRCRVVFVGDVTSLRDEVDPSKHNCATMFARMKKRPGGTTHLSISLPTEEVKLLKRRAKRVHGGNVSRAISEAIRYLAYEEGRDAMIASFGRRGTPTEKEAAALDLAWGLSARKSA